MNKKSRNSPTFPWSRRNHSMSKSSTKAKPLSSKNLISRIKNLKNFKKKI
jgi:hypothetical protein